MSTTIAETPEWVAAEKQAFRDWMAREGQGPWPESDVRVPGLLRHTTHVANEQHPGGPFVHWQHPESCACDVPDARRR